MDKNLKIISYMPRINFVNQKLVLYIMFVLIKGVLKLCLSIIVATVSLVTYLLIGIVKSY